MKIFLRFFIPLLTLITAIIARAENFSFKEPFTRTGAFNATGEIILENINGDVDIHTWDKNEILIEGEKSAKTEEELKLIDLTIDLSASAATLKVKLPKRSGGWFFSENIRGAVRFKLTVPVGAVLAKVSAVNSTLTLAGVHGKVHGATVNGSIHATGLAGDTKLETVNGSITARFDSIVAGQKISLSSVNGPTNVRVPKDAGLDFHGSTVNGQVDCGFPLLLGQKNRGRKVTGKIGDGRASLSAETVNGSVHLESD